MNSIQYQFDYGVKVINNALSEFNKQVENFDQSSNIKPKVSLSEEQLFELSLKISTGIHILRNTLDHAMWNLALQNETFCIDDPQLCRLISFPIKYDENEFNRWKNKVVSVYSEEVLNFVESLQPYKSRVPSIYTRAIATIAKCDNSAKHVEPWKITHYRTIQKSYMPITDELSESIVEINLFPDDERSIPIRVEETSEEITSLSYNIFVQENDVMIYKDFSGEIGEWLLFMPLRTVIKRFSQSDFSPLDYLVLERDVNTWNSMQSDS